MPEIDTSSLEGNEKTFPNLNIIFSQAQPSPQELVLNFVRKEWYNIPEKVGPLAQKMEEVEDWLKNHEQ